MVTDRIANYNQTRGAPNGATDAPGAETQLPPYFVRCGQGSAVATPRPARWLWQSTRRLRPQMVILFGSRARGDYHDGSDIDLLVITGDKRLDNDGYFRASRAAHQKVDEIYTPPVGVDVLNYTGAEFADWRRAKTPRRPARPPGMA